MSQAPLSKEEVAAISAGEILHVEKLTVHGTYKNGLPFVREYPVDDDLFPDQSIIANLMLNYPDPLLDGKAGVLQ